MVDLLTIAGIKKLHPKLRVEGKLIYDEICQLFPGPSIGVRFVQVLRTFAEQDALYAQGRNGDKRPKVTNARGGQSYHNYGLAIDFCLLRGREVIWDTQADLDKDQMADWMEVVTVFLKHGWKWGASFGDYPHFEKTFGNHHTQLLALLKAGKVDDNGYVLI